MFPVYHKEQSLGRVRIRPQCMTYLEGTGWRLYRDIMCDCFVELHEAERTMRMSLEALPARF